MLVTYNSRDELVFKVSEARKRTIARRLAPENTKPVTLDPKFQITKKDTKRIE